MIRILARICGEADCPGCDSDELRREEPGFYICTNCDAVVDYERGGWRYAGGSELRRLPGLMGMRFDRMRAA